MTLQDYDVIVRLTLPQDFARWQDNPVWVTYRSTDALTTDNALSISMLDTSGAVATLSGSVTNLASAAWATTQADIVSGTWVAGEDVVLRFHLSAKEQHEMDLGALRLRYVTIQGR